MLDYINRLLNKWKHQPFANYIYTVYIYIYWGKHRTNGFIFISIDGESPILIYGESSYGKIELNRVDQMICKWVTNSWIFSMT